jgi:hypothetical protein
VYVREMFQEIEPVTFRARMRSLQTRPAYTLATFARALTDGLDAGGRVLAATMPRYNLSAAESADLAAYLQTLNAFPAVGVDSFAIHFATVVTEAADPQQARSMLDLMRAYFARKNRATDGILARKDRPDLCSASLAARSWVLHIWQLKGAASSWQAQLETAYRDQPVLAMIGGMGAGEWRPVSAFCDHYEMRCLFPQLVAADTAGSAYTLYFSQGPIDEARVLAQYLGTEKSPIVQIYRSENANAATAFRRSLPQGLKLRDIPIPRDTELTSTFWDALLGNARPAALVLWLRDCDLHSFPRTQARNSQPFLFYLSATLVPDPRLLSLDRTSIRLIYPYSLSPDPVQESVRVQGWKVARGLEPAISRVQLNTYFVLALVDDCLQQMAGVFSRRFLIETVERNAETATNAGVYPRISLGPGRRFASHGAQIVRWKPGTQMEFEPVSNWINP